MLDTYHLNEGVHIEGNGKSLYLIVSELNTLLGEVGFEIKNWDGNLIYRKTIGDGGELIHILNLAWVDGFNLTDSTVDLHVFLPKGYHAMNVILEEGKEMVYRGF